MCGVRPFQLHGFGMDACMSSGACFRRSSEIELHPYSVDGELIFPVVIMRLDRILSSKYNGLLLFSMGFGDFESFLEKGIWVGFICGLGSGCILCLSIWA